VNVPKLTLGSFFFKKTSITLWLVKIGLILRASPPTASLYTSVMPGLPIIGEKTCPTDCLSRFLFFFFFFLYSIPVFSVANFAIRDVQHPDFRRQQCVRRTAPTMCPDALHQLPAPCPAFPRVLLPTCLCHWVPI
jgi:hypothetical protein